MDYKTFGVIKPLAHRYAQGLLARWRFRLEKVRRTPRAATRASAPRRAPPRRPILAFAPL